MSPLVQKLYAVALARYFDWLRCIHRRPLALFFRDGGIGDVLCTLPATAALAQRESASYKIYCTNPAFVTLPAMIDGLDRIMGIRCSDLVAARVRHRHRVYRFRYPDEEPGESSSRYLADEFATPFDLPSGLPWPRLATGRASPRVEQLFAGRGAETVVCVHTGPTWAVREWPLPAWDELVSRLRARGSCRVLHVGASRHFREGERRERAVAGTEDCRDIFDLRETMQLIERSRLLVGIDSGMIHAAVAFGVPVVGVFGPTSPALRMPTTNAVGMVADVPCSGCHHRHPRLHWQSGCPHTIRCMKELTPDAVFEKATRFLC